MKTKNWWVSAIFYAASLFMLVSLALYAYLGTFTRYMADDYCTAAIVKNVGFWEAQSRWWENWSGRYSFTFVVSLVELLGVWIVPVLPGLIIVLWLFVSVWAGLPFLRRMKINNPIAVGIFVASLSLWLTYRNIDDYPQIAFWQTGILTYTIFPVLFLLGIGIAVRRVENPAQLGWLELVGWFLFAFVVGGFSETGAVLQMVLIAYLMIFVFLTKWERRRLFIPVLCTTLLGSILSLLTMASAPGTIVRSKGFAHLPPLGLSIPGLLKHVLLFAPDLIDRSTMSVVLGFLGGIFLVYCCMPDQKMPSNLSIVKAFIASLFLAMAGILGGLAPQYLLSTDMPRERVLLFTYWLVMCNVIFFGALFAMLLMINLPPKSLPLQRWISIGLFITLATWGIRPVLISRLELIPDLHQYSLTWDRRHEYLLSVQQQKDAVIFTEDLMKIESLEKLRTKLWLTGDFETSSDYWINLCVAQYYGVGEVTAK